MKVQMWIQNLTCLWRGSRGAVAPLSPLSSWRSWRRLLKGHITQTSTPERSWPRGQSSQRPECRLDQCMKTHLTVVLSGYAQTFHVNCSCCRHPRQRETLWKTQGQDISMHMKEMISWLLYPHNLPNYLWTILRNILCWNFMGKKFLLSRVRDFAIGKKTGY